MNAAGEKLLPEGIRILDRTERTDYIPVLSAFALDELLCRRVGEGAAPLVHFWRHPRAFVLGLRDNRLPQAKEAVRWLEELGYSVAVRNSGGAAVPLDLGVVNVSLIVPKPQGSVDFRKDFEMMYRFLSEGLQRFTSQVEKGEVAGSYCPGDFDLGIGGKKFCGIAQRRHANALVVQAFVVVEGSGAQRAAMAKAFYEKAAAGAPETDYPKVRPDSMGSLSELLRQPIPAEQFTASLREWLAGQGMARNAGPQELPDGEELQRTMIALRERYVR
jgi:octanoyl-[GcvH]:protein N-octanoyltransferase